ncbi:MAG: FAD-binding protein [Cypionkella sp.]|nr:FAD-binding protein [Cypionkella sp.]
MITPRSEVELAKAVATANAPLTVRGGGTRAMGEAHGIVLHTGALTGVTLYEPAALTLVVKAGTPLADIEALLAGERQRLGFEPPDLRALLGRDGQSTIGGVVAANAAGPRGVQLGAARDALLGVRFVDGRGDVISSGGRVMKNVTGYDLVKLLAGSHGSLGVLTEVSLKVQSLPETETTLIFDGLDEAAGLAVLRAAQASPYDITGAARAGGRSYIRLEGMAGSVAYRTQKLRDLGAADLATDAASADIWRGLRDGAPLQGRAGDIWHIVTLPTHAAALVADITAQTGADLASDVIYDHAGAAVWAALPEGVDAVLRARLGAMGQARKLRGAGAAPFGPQIPAVTAVSGAIKAQFDPMGRFAQRAIF